MIGLTIFKNLFDNTTDKSMQFDDFDRFEAFMYKLSEIEYRDKKDASLMTPASFLPDTTRANVNVIEWQSWAAVDVDDQVYDGDLKEELIELYGQYRFICYSTASSTIAKPKFRLIFPLSAPVKQAKIKHFWFALNKELGDIGDPQTKDLSRMYFVPGKYIGSNAFIFSNTGDLMDPSILMGKYEYAVKTGNSFLDKLPASVREQLIKHRKEQMDNTSIAWSNYHNCPFINRRLVVEYQTINETGWYSKMYAIMVSIAINAIRQKYPINSMEIADLCTQIDNDNGGWYKNRPLTREAEGAIKFAYENTVDI